MTNYFLLSESLMPCAERGPVTTQAHTRAPLQHHTKAGSIPASCRGAFTTLPSREICQGSARRPFPVSSWTGGYTRSPALLNQHLQAWNSQPHHQAATGLKQRPLLPKSPSPSVLLPC